MAFITFSNAKNIIRKTNIKDLDLKGNIYKRPIFFFSKYEKNSLLVIQELLKDPENFFTEIYTPLKEKVDTYSYVYEREKPAYHNSIDCPLIHSDYNNFEIPEVIKNKGIDEIKRFRNWFKHNEYLLDKPDVFVMRLDLKWGIKTNLRAINFENSGWSEIDNYDLEKLESKIDALIKDAGRYYYASDKNKKILRRFSKLTFLAYQPGVIDDNNTGFNDEIVKQFLKDYDDKYKKPLKYYLIEYFRLKLNPNIKLDGRLLDKLNFKPCSKCYKISNYSKSLSKKIPHYHV